MWSGVNFATSSACSHPINLCLQRMPLCFIGCCTNFYQLHSTHSLGLQYTALQCAAFTNCTVTAAQPSYGKRAYSYADAVRWCCDIADGLTYLHGVNPVVVHRDMKAENILMLGARSNAESSWQRRICFCASVTVYCLCLRLRSIDTQFQQKLPCAA